MHKVFWGQKIVFYDFLKNATLLLPTKKYGHKTFVKNGPNLRGVRVPKTLCIRNSKVCSLTDLSSIWVNLSWWDSVLKDIPYLLYSLEPCGESTIQLNLVMETRIVSTNVFAAEVLPRVACIWLVSTNADSGIIVNVNYIDLYLRALVIGIGSNPGNTGSIRTRRTGGTIPLPAVFDSSHLWIVFDGDDLLNVGYYSNFASSLGFELEVYSPNKSRKLS